MVSARYIEYREIAFAQVKAMITFADDRRVLPRADTSVTTT
jgi:hypothetical protein